MSRNVLILSVFFYISFPNVCMYVYVYIGIYGCVYLCR